MSDKLDSGIVRTAVWKYSPWLNGYKGQLGTFGSNQVEADHSSEQYRPRWI